MNSEFKHKDLFLINGDVNGIRIEAIGKRTAREVVFMVPPDLTPGEYTLQVRVRFGQDERVDPLATFLPPALSIEAR